MKKIIALIIVTAILTTTLAFANQPFDVRVPELRAIKTNTEDASTLLGSPNGLENISNATYMDIKDTFGQEAVVRLSAFGVIQQKGSRTYAPTAMVTGFEAITHILHVINAQDAVMGRVNAQIGSSSTQAQINQLTNAEMLQEARNRGIVTADEVLGLADPVTRERLAVWMARAIGLQAQNAQNGIFTYTDWGTVNPTYRGLVEAMVKENIMSLNNDGSFGPKRQVSKGELATIGAAAFETQYAARGITLGFGLVMGIQSDTISEADNKITRKTITVRNTDGTVTRLVSETHTKGNRRFDYVTFKDNLVSDNRLIALGDEIAYYTQGNDLIYVQVLNNNLVMEVIDASLPVDPYSIHHFGTVSDIMTQTATINGRSVISEFYRIVNVSGDVFDIVVDEDMFSGQRDDILTFKNGVIGSIKSLAIGDVIEYIVNDQNQVPYIKVVTLSQNLIAGTIRETEKGDGILPDTVTIFGYDNKLYKLPLAPYSNLTINGRVAGLNDYVYGMPVDANVVGGYVMTLSGESYTGEPGYIPTFGKMRMGDVTHVYSNSFSIKLSTGVTETVQVTPRTQFTKDGNSVDIKALKVGIPVKLYYDDISSNIVSKVEIEAPEILFEIIYKGKMVNVNGMRSEIQLTGTDGTSKPEYILNNTWTPADTFSVNLKVNERTQIYAGNQKLTMSDLNRYYANYPAYAVVKSVFGQPTVVKLSVMTGGEQMYSSAVRSVDHTLGEFEITTKENFNLTDGTIVIRDGLLVPIETLSTRDTVLVVSERLNHERNAMVVKVVTPYDTIFNSIRIGALEQTNMHSITLRNHTQYFNNFINRVNPNESGTYNFYTQSVIKDVSDPMNVITLKAEDLFHKSYARSENVNRDFNINTQGLQFNRYYAFMIVNDMDQSIIAMHLRKGGLLPGQNIDGTLYREDQIATALENTYQNAVLSRGVVTSKDTTWDRVEITDSHDWTDYTGRWTANRANIFIRYTDAIIVKNNRIITIDDVKPGDYMYIMRIKDQGLVIFVES